MSDIEDLRTRLVGKRFYDHANEEAFTVVGITAGSELALLQYDDGVAWDEGASAFSTTEDVAFMMGLSGDGLDSERYTPLGPGPRVDQICDSDAHTWFPTPDQLWPGGPTDDLHDRLETSPRTLYSRLVRCKRCGLSGDVASQFSMYGRQTTGYHHPPWFCTDCGEVFDDADLEYHGDLPYCADCVGELDDALIEP